MGGTQQRESFSLHLVPCAPRVPILRIIMSAKKLYLVAYNAVVCAAWAYCLYLTFANYDSSAKGLTSTYSRLEFPLKARPLDSVS